MNMQVKETSKLHAHMGNVLMREAGTYRNLGLTLLEIVQNAIDSDAKLIKIVLDRQKRNLDVMDNGNGVTRGLFEKALASFAHTIKAKDKLGQFGIGLISPLGKCDHFTFTSTAKGGDGVYRRWTFVSKDIAGMFEVEVPMEEVVNLRHGRVDKTLTIDSGKVSQVTWRTRVSLRNYSADRELSKIGSVDECVKSIFARFGTAMHRRKVKLDVRFVAPDGSVEERKGLEPPSYTGQPLPKDLRQLSDGGFLRSQLYLALRDTRGRGKGQVVVGQQGNDFRFPFGKFARAHTDSLHEEAVRALTSGLFEGEILASKVDLHEGRESFLENEALVAMCEGINEWFVEIGSQYINEAEEAQRDERYQKLGERALESLRDVLADPRYDELRELLEETGRTSENAGAAAADFLESVVEQEPVFEAQGGGIPPEEEPRGVLRIKKPQLKRPKHTVRGPRGVKANLATIRRFGLRFCYTELPGNDNLWLLEDGTWTLVFNTLHPLWVQCDEFKSDRRVMQLMEIVTVAVLNWVVAPAGGFQEQAREMVDDIIRGQIGLLLRSPSFNPSKRK